MLVWSDIIFRVCWLEQGPPNVVLGYSCSIIIHSLFIAVERVLHPQYGVIEKLSTPLQQQCLSAITQEHCSSSHISHSLSALKATSACVASLESVLHCSKPTYDTEHLTVALKAALDSMKSVTVQCLY